jgi:hypothetical protein
MPSRDSDSDHEPGTPHPAAIPDEGTRLSAGVVWADILAEIATDERAARNRSARTERDAA